LAIGFGELPPVDLPEDVDVLEEELPPGGVPPPAGAIAAPVPVDAADPSPGWRSAEQSRQSTSSATLTTMEVDCLWCAALATNCPF
jgi:hypothetical protein